MAIERKERTTVGYLQVVEHGVTHRSALIVCPGYGMICYALGVTNGYLIQCAISIKQMFDGLERARKESEDPSLEYVFILEDEVLDVPNITKDALLERLKVVYKKYGE